MKGIVLKPWEVQAILDGRKSRITRVMKLPRHIEEEPDGTYTLYAEGTAYAEQNLKQLSEFKYLNSPYQVGNILYGKETFCQIKDIPKWGDYFRDGNRTEDYNEYVYYADNIKVYGVLPPGINWHSSIHMPQDAARIFMRVTGVRVERLQEMNLDDFLGEGITVRQEAFNDPENAYLQAKNGFLTQWNTDYSKGLDLYGWDANPWVWVYEIERIEKQ